MRQILYVHNIRGSINVAVNEINRLGWADHVIAVNEAPDRDGLFTSVVLRVTGKWLRDNGIE